MQMQSVFFFNGEYMTFIFTLLVICFFLGLLSRDQGDGLLDTLGSGAETGCGIIIFMVVVGGILAVLAS